MKYLIIALLWLASCTTTKEVEKTITVDRTDSTAVHQRDSLRLEITKQRIKYEDQIRTIKNTGVVFSDCDTIIIDSSCNIDSAIRVIKLLQKRVRILADGSIEAEGNIKAAYSNSENLRQYNYELEQHNMELTHLNDSLIIKLDKYTKVKSTHKDVKRGFPWFWFIMGGVVFAALQYLWERLKLWALVVP